MLENWLSKEYEVFEKSVLMFILMYILLLTLLVSEEVLVSPAPPPLTPLTSSRGSKEATV